MLFWKDMIAWLSMLEVLLFLMSIWTFILNHLDLNIHATINKITLRNMLGSIPHKKFCFYHLPTRGRVWIKLGGAWYISNVSIIFDCSMLLYYMCWMFMGFIIQFIIIGTNLLTQSPVSGPVFHCFRVSQILNGIKLLRWFFLDQKTNHRLGDQLGRATRRPQGRKARSGG